MPTGTGIVVNWLALAILLRVDYDAGHGIGSTKDQRQRQLADEWAFLLWQVGEALR